MPTRPRIYVTQPVAQSALERLRAVADVEMNPDTLHIVTKGELLSAVRGRDVLFCLLHDRVDREVIAAEPRLRMIASMKITPSDIAVDEATARRIPVTVIPPIVTEATADIHFALLLAVARRVVEGDSMLTGDFSPPPNVLAQVVKRQKDQLALIPAGSARYVSMNTTVEPFDDVNVRRAVVAGGTQTPLVHVPPPVHGTVDLYRASLLWSRRFIGLKVFLTLAELGEGGLLQIHVLEHRLDDDVDLIEAVVSGGRRDERRRLFQDHRAGLLHLGRPRSWRRREGCNG